MKQRARGFSIVLCGTALMWAFAAQALSVRAARGLSGRFALAWAEPLLEALGWIFLLWVGLGVLRWITSEREVSVWPRRWEWSREFGLGVALGWGLALVSVMPVMLTGHLHSQLTLGAASWGPAVVSMLTLGVVTLAEELVFRGYAFRRLIAGIGPAWATIVISGLFAAAVAWGSGSFTAVFVTWLFGILLAAGYVRSHGLWISWGLHFVYRAVVAVVFGLPIAGRNDFGALTNSYATGPGWLSGGDFGLDAAAFTIVAMLVASAVLVRTTRWYAWEYTHPAIVAGGYEVSVAPPPAHVAMEQQAAAAPPPLVQILTSTPENRSVMDDVSRYEQPSK